MSSTSTFDETYEPRPWACGECKYVLGVVMRDHKRIRRLWVFRVHILAENMPKALTLQNTARGLFSVHGIDCIPSPGGVECQHCGALNDWSMSKESFDRLMERYEVKHESV